MTPTNQPGAIVVTGTDTGIGKTVFAAGLTAALGARYWKPIQSGLEDGSDARSVAALGVPVKRRLGAAYVLAAAYAGAAGAVGPERIIALPLREAREVFEREYLSAQILRFGGNISRTAAFIGMERSALHRKLRALGVNSNERTPDIRH